MCLFNFKTIERNKISSINFTKTFFSGEINKYSRGMLEIQKGKKETKI